MKIRRILIAVMLAVVCLLFTGCSSYVSVYRNQLSDDAYTSSVDVFAAKSDIDVLESNGGSVKAYLNSLMNACEVNERGGEYAITEDGDGNLYVTFAISVDSSYIEDEDYSVTKTEGFFFHSYKLRFKNPLDKLKNAFKNGMDQKPAKGSDMYLVWVLLNGEGTLKSFTEYFGVDKSIADKLVLNFLLKTRMLYESSAKTEYVLNQKYFKWTTTVESNDGYIEYTVKGANSWVWYAAAVVLGLIVLLVLWLIARKSKKTPKLCDNTELERMRAMSRNGAANARVSAPPPPKQPNKDVFEDGESEQEENKEQDKENN